MADGRRRWRRQLSASVIRLSLTLLTGLVAAQAALGLSAEVANSGEEAAPETITATLEPGDNLIGWVSEPIGIDELFAAIPEATLIYTWSAEERRYRYASREEGGTLETLEPGMTAVIRIIGDKPVEWQRPLTPAKGIVTLYRGVNWVTWVGRDDWPLDQVARGIGTSLVSIRVGDVTYPAPLGDSLGELPVLRRGDPLEVTVSRDLRWLQPTGMMPKIFWAGEPSQSLQEEVHGDIRAILDFLAEEFAIESDFSETTILLFGSIDAAVEHAESGAEPRFLYSPEHLRSTLETGWEAEAQPWGFFMWACGWKSQPPPACPGSKAATLAHEWFHVLQDQLSTRHPHLSPTWMSEGTATWLNWRFSTAFSSASYEDRRQWRIDRVAQTSEPLKAGENGFYSWVYDLGAVVADRLVEKHGIDSLLEFDRWLYPQLVGQDRRWVREPTWHEAFEGVFGVTVEAFYDEFATWRETLPEPKQTREVDPDDVQLSGTIRHSDGSAATDFIVFVQEYVGEIPIGREQTSVVNEAGEFAFYVATETIQRLRVAKDGCELWLTNNGLTVGRAPEGEYRELDTRKLTVLELTLPESACENKLSVSVASLHGDNREVDLLLNSEDGERWFGFSTSGSVGPTVYAPEAGQYRLRVTLDGCNLWYHQDGLVASSGRSALINLSEQPVSIQVRVPDDLCLQRINGRLIDEDGAAAGGIWLFATTADGQGFGYSFARTTEDDGEFIVTVPVSGDYRLSFYEDGCQIHYNTSGVTTDRRKATLISVAAVDVTGIEFIVPTHPASVCN